MSEPIVTAVEHVSIAVRDAEGAKQTFAALGFEPQWVEDLPSQGLRSHVLRAEGVVLELIEPAAAAPAAGSLERFLARRGEGLHHLCLRVNSLAEATRAVEAAGMRLVDRVPTVDEQGRRVFVHPDSAHGTRTSLGLRPPDSSASLFLARSRSGVAAVGEMPCPDHIAINTPCPSGRLPFSAFKPARMSSSGGSASGLPSKRGPRRSRIVSISAVGWSSLGSPES